MVRCMGHWTFLIGVYLKNRLLKETVFVSFTFEHTLIFISNAELCNKL